MSWASVGANLASNVTGNVSKAFLLVKTPTKIKKDDDTLGSLTSKLDTASSVISSFTGTADMAFSLSQIANANSVFNASTIKKKLIGSDFHCFEFQYNPETIHMGTQAGSFMNRQGVPDSGINQVTMTNIPAQTNINFRVKFNKVNNKDAFAYDKLHVQTGADLAQAVEGAVSTYTIQPQVDGLLSLFSQNTANHVVFIYGNMIFAGELENISAQYTMFSPTGHPIAAELDMSIRHRSAFAVSEKGKEEPTSDLIDNYWRTAYTNFLGKPGKNVEVNLRNTADKVGTLLNFNL